MNVLIACEESQAVCKAFRKRGHEAYSCDILPCSGGHPEWHIQGDVLPLIAFNPILRQMFSFNTQDGATNYLNHWDLIIAHPPCTYFSLAGNSWFNESKYGEKAIKRKSLRQDAYDFFMKFVNAPCDKIAIENPLGTISTMYRKADQIIHPWQFGHATRKPTCLWLKGLPLLQPTEIVKPIVITHKSGRTDSEWHFNSLHLPPAERSKARSKTFENIAKAMAEQWG